MNGLTAHLNLRWINDADIWLLICSSVYIIFTVVQADQNILTHRCKFWHVTSVWVNLGDGILEIAVSLSRFSRYLSYSFAHESLRTGSNSIDASVNKARQLGLPRAVMSRSCLELPVHPRTFAGQFFFCPLRRRPPSKVPWGTWCLSVMRGHMTKPDQPFAVWLARMGSSWPTSPVTVFRTKSLVLYSLYEIWSSFIRLLFSNTYLHQPPASTSHMRRIETSRDLDSLCSLRCCCVKSCPA